jgi:hypothetical protein
MICIQNSQAALLNNVTEHAWVFDPRLAYTGENLAVLLFLRFQVVFRRVDAVRLVIY